MNEILEKMVETKNCFTSIYFNGDNSPSACGIIRKHTNGKFYTINIVDWVFSVREVVSIDYDEVKNESIITIW